MKVDYINHMGDDLTGINLAWASGIIEGEGTISLIKVKDRKNSYSPRITVTMTDKDIIKRLFDIFKVGTIRGPIKNKNHKDLWSWSVQNQSGCFNVLIEIMPYLGDRRLTKAKELFKYLEGKLI